MASFRPAVLLATVGEIGRCVRLLANAVGSDGRLSHIPPKILDCAQSHHHNGVERRL